jgi:glycosyltransferase involved in cell wall biosynthesis
MKRATITAIVCAFNEAPILPACLHSLLSQTRPPDEIVVVNNASTDETAAVARAVPGVRVVEEPIKGLAAAREAARRVATGDLLAYVDADCRVPLQWLERMEQRFLRRPAVVAVSGPYRFYDWDAPGRLLIRAYDVVVAPPTHFLVHYALGAGAILYGGDFVARAGPRPHRRLRRVDRVPRRGHERRPAADAARFNRAGARVLGVDVGAPVPCDGQAARVRTLCPELLVGNSQAPSGRSRSYRRADRSDRPIASRH